MNDIKNAVVVRCKFCGIEINTNKTNSSKERCYDCGEEIVRYDICSRMTAGFCIDCCYGIRGKTAATTTEIYCSVTERKFKTNPKIPAMEYPL
jgi:hypothetical protein